LELGETRRPVGQTLTIGFSINTNHVKFLFGIFGPIAQDEDSVLSKETCHPLDDVLEQVEKASLPVPPKMGNSSEHTSNQVPFAGKSQLFGAEIETLDCNTCFSRTF